VTRLTQIAGALLILWLFCRHLQVPRELAGIPRYPASPIPALATLGVAFIGMLLANLLLNALQGPDPNAAAGGVVGNGWAWLSLFSDLNAGVVEEIVIVAVPVLVGRRAGWHPAAIVAVSMALRWPFHTSTTAPGQPCPGRCSGAAATPSRSSTSAGSPR
jgi:hypothetical protein